MQILNRPRAPEPPADAKLRSQWYGRKKGVRNDLLKGTKATDDSCHYLSVALPLYRRGFVVWNISKKSDKAGGKAGASGWNSLTYEAPEDLHRFIAGKYPDANACVISRRGVGNPIVLDIDADGVVERIERETEHKLPATYTVETRPKTAKFKRHYYFLQTEFSVASFEVEMNGIFKDLSRTETKDGQQVHPNMLDVKGCGRGGFVVAAGSVRKPDEKCPEGDTYTCINEADLVPIPEWLVTWLKNTRAAIEQAGREAQEKRDMVNASRTPEEIKRLQDAGDESAFNVSYDNIGRFLDSRAKSLARLGVGAELREKCLVEQCVRECAGGAKWMESHPDRIYEIAYNPERVLGNSGWFKRMKPKTSSKTPKGSLVIQAPAPTRQSVIVETMNGFRDEINSAEGWKKLIESCKLATPPLSKDRAGYKAVSLGLAKAGFKVHGVRWQRETSTLSIPHIQVR